MKCLCCFRLGFLMLCQTNILLDQIYLEKLEFWLVGLFRASNSGSRAKDSHCNLSPPWWPEFAKSVKWILKLTLLIMSKWSSSCGLAETLDENYLWYFILNLSGDISGAFNHWTIINVDDCFRDEMSDCLKALN